MATGKTKAIIALVVFIIVVAVVLGVGLGVALKKEGTLRFYADLTRDTCSSTYEELTVQFKDIHSCNTGLTANGVQLYYYVQQCPPPNTAYYCAWVYDTPSCTDSFTFFSPSDCISIRGISGSKNANVQWIAA